MHLAQINVARMQQPLDTEHMKEFREFLDPMNALAESSPGFVWRLVADEDSDSVYFDHPGFDELYILNMSVWEDFSSLKQFVYHTVHAYFVRSRKRWFERMERPHAALWWVALGHEPSVQEALKKLDRLNREGSSAEVFDWKNLYDERGNAVRELK